MLRLLVSAALLLPAVFAQAQTTIKITMPDSSTCTYPTGQVSTNSTPGQLQATASAAGTGAGCGGPAGVGSVTFGPASPLAPNSQSLGNGGGTANFNFEVVNATQCNGTIVGPSGGKFASSGAATATGLCAATGCSGPQTFAATFLGNAGGTDLLNTVTLTCNGASGPAAVSTATVTVLHTVSGGSCATIQASPSGSFTQWTGNHSVYYYSAGSRTVDVTSFSALFNGTWPGQYGLIADMSIPATQYVSAQFTVPANYMTASNVPASLYGKFQVGQSNFSTTLSMTVSTECGDFSNPTSPGSSVVPGCYLNKGGANTYIRWTNTGASCALSDAAPNNVYYLNIINADISNVTHGGGTATSTGNQACSGSTCSDPILTGNGTWQGYTPN